LHGTQTVSQPLSIITHDASTPAKKVQDLRDFRVLIAELLLTYGQRLLEILYCQTVVRLVQIKMPERDETRRHVQVAFSQNFAAHVEGLFQILLRPAQIAALVVIGADSHQAGGHLLVLLPEPLAPDMQ